jgi:hypothetical protein
VLEQPLRAASILASAVVILSFALFAIDEADGASRQSQAGIAGGRAAQVADPSPAQERARERVHGSAREAVDDADDVLVGPVAWVVPAGSGKWTARGVPTLLALVLYGFGLGFLARFARGRA